MEELKSLERVIKALANRRRLMIIRLLRERPDSSVGAIAKEIKLSFKATSKHLSVLGNADLVEKEQKSLNMFYRLIPPAYPFVKQLIASL